MGNKNKFCYPTALKVYDKKIPLRGKIFAKTLRASINRNAEKNLIELGEIDKFLRNVKRYVENVKIF